MDQIKIISKVISDYSNSSKLNEADTRFIIIDEIIEKVLSWPKNSISCEMNLNGQRADYILKKKNGKPALIIESKKEGVFFELPAFINSKRNFDKIKVSKLITDGNIKDAIYQVKDYCEDHGANYGCITNGHVWIIFQIYSSKMPWKDMHAFVIKNLAFFRDDFTKALNLLGYNSVVNEDSLNREIGLQKNQRPEVYYPKDSISAYNTVVNNNEYAGFLNSLAKKFLGNIDFADIDFVKNCYVVDKGHYDSLEKNLSGVINDSLTPFFSNLNVIDIRDESLEGGAFTLKIQELLKKENSGNLMILYGGRGSGKSTFIKRLLFYIRPRDIEQYSKVAVINLLNAAQTEEEIVKEIWQEVCNSIDQDKILESSKKDLLSLFSDRFLTYKNQILDGIPEIDVTYQKEVNRFIRERKSDVKYCSQRISNYWRNKRKGLIIVLDNLDQLPPNLQDTCFLTASEISNKLNCLVIISMREERYYNAKSRGVLDAYMYPGFHLASPVIPKVISKRISFILKKLKAHQDFDFSNNINQLPVITDFLAVCNKEINRNGSAISKFLRYSTHGDVRQALEFFKGFLTSGYTNINEMASGGLDWKFQQHQVLKPVMIPERFFYDEKISKIPNIFQLRNESNSSHFTGLRILSRLNSISHDKLNSGFIDANYLVQEFEDLYDLKEDCIKNLDVFLNRGLLESNNRLEGYTEDVDQIRITAFGKYIFENLASEFTYIELVSLDCGIYDLTMHNSFVKSAGIELKNYYEGDFENRISLRIKRVEDFLNYLKRIEDQEFEDLNVQNDEVRFSDKLLSNFAEQKLKINWSVENKLNRS